ncbi:hypothetical protein [Pontibacter chitinilyticus]|uniref:hypothetical protein n=1 Tax=Pontibacter chitinilyticus TaxID=2674989 RepID=UPI00321BA96B
MITKHIQHFLTAFCLLIILGISGCQTSNAPVGTNIEDNRRLAPQRVDIRGSIVTSRYDKGQVMLEVNGFPSSESRYERAYVLVEPTTQIVGADGQSMSLSELQQGQNVAILMRGGGQGNFVGVGVARKVWIESTF